jgi:hypothetical protein
MRGVLFMSGYRRLIAYIYEYDGKVRLANKGFVRIDVRDGCGRLYISMKDIREKNSTQNIWFYRWHGGIMHTIQTGEILICEGSGETKLTFMEEQIEPDISFEDIGGVVIGRGETRMYGAEWDEREINMQLLDINGAKPEEFIIAECAGESEENNETESEQECESQNAALKGREMDDWRSIFEEGKLLQPFDDDMMYDCVETKPELMLRAPFCERNFYYNSFLLHGYFCYGHLLVGKLAGEGNRYFVGVPGTYNNRERVMAAMYGFENFRKSIRRDNRHPYFGYWYSVVEDYTSSPICT